MTIKHISKSELALTASLCVALLNILNSFHMWLCMVISKMGLSDRICKC